MSRWGKNIVVPLDSLCKEKENTNRPTVARSVGTVGKWGKMGFTSTRTYTLSALHPMAAAAAAAAAAASPAQSPASTHDHDPNDLSVSVPEPPKPKKFFKSRNAAPPEVIAQIIQQMPHCVATSPMRDQHATPAAAHETLKQKLAKGNSAERKRKSPKKKAATAAAAATATPVTPSTPGAFGLDRDDLDAGSAAEHLESGDEPRSSKKKPKAKEEKKLKPEAPPSRILGRARKAVNYREVDEDDRYPTPTKDLIIPKSRTPTETVTSATATAAALAANSTEAISSTAAGSSPDSGPALPPPTTVPSAAAAAVVAAATALPLSTSASATNPTSASRTPEHPPIVLRISKGTSRLVSTDSEEPPSSSPAHQQYHHQHQQQQQQQLLQQHQQHHLQYQNQSQSQQQHLEESFGGGAETGGALEDRRDEEREKVPAVTPKIIVKPLRAPASGAEGTSAEEPEEPEEDADEEEEEEEEEEPPEINYCTVKISPDKPPKERLKLIIKTDVIRNAIAKAAAAAAAKAAGEETRSEKKSKSKKHKHLKHAQLAEQQQQQQQLTSSGGAVPAATAVVTATATVTAEANSEFKTPSPHLALNEQQQQQQQQPRQLISPTTRSDHDFDSQSSVLGSISSKGNSTPLLLAQAVQEDSCVIRSRGSSVITSDLESSQHSSLVAPPSDIESRLESMMMTIDGGSAAAGTTVSDVAPGPLQEDILAVLRGDVTRVNGAGEEPAAAAVQQEEQEPQPPKRTTRGRGRKANNNVDAAPAVTVAETRTRGRAKAAEATTSPAAVAAPAPAPAPAPAAVPKRATRGTRGAKKAELEMEMEVESGNDPEEAAAAAVTATALPRRGRNAAARANNNNLASINNNINKIAASLSAKAEASRLAEGGPAPAARSYGRKRKNQQVTQLVPQEASTENAPAAAPAGNEEEEDEQPTPAKMPHTQHEPEAEAEAEAEADEDAAADHDNEPDPDPDLDEAEDSNSNSNNSSLQHDGSSSSPPPRDFKFKDKFKRTLTLDTQAAAAAAEAEAEAAAPAAGAATATEGIATSTVAAAAPAPPPPAEAEPRGAVKLVISKKKGSIFKSRALVPSDQAEQASVAKRHLYKHSWDAALEANGGGTGSDASNASAPGGVSSTGGKDHMLHMHLLATKSDGDFCDSPSSNNNTSSGSCSSSTLRDDSPAMGLGLGLGLGKVSRSTAKQVSLPVAHTMVEGFDMNAAEVEELGLERVVGLSSVGNLVGSSSGGGGGGGAAGSGSGSGGGGGSGAPLRVDRKTKEYYTVVRNVKTAHQIQEIGEYQEMDDDVEYILDALQPHNPPATRCLSALQLATKCMMPAFRMHVRAHGVVTKFFKALSDANRDLSLGLCTSAIMYILSQEGLNMDLDRDSLELMINLLEADGVGVAGAAPSDQRANYERNKQKVRELCEEIKAQGKGTHLNVESITVGTLAMETLLSLTSKRAGEWFKEDLRKLGGLEHIIKTISDFCRPIIACDMDMERQITWVPVLLDNMQTVARCLRVLENVTQHNEANQRYMLTFSKGRAVDTLCLLYRLCSRQLVLHPSTTELATGSNSRKEHPGVAMRELLINVMKVLISLTHTFNEAHPSLGADLLGKRGDVIETSFQLLLLSGNYIPDNCVFELSILVLTLLINLCMYTPRNRTHLMEAFAPAEYVAETPPVQGRVSALQALIEYFYKCEELARLVEKNTDAFLESNETGKKKQEEVEETVNNLLQRAGHHMEHTLKGSYAAILVGNLITDNELYEAIVRRQLRGHSFREVVGVLEKYHTFMNLTSSLEAAVVSHMKSTKRIIDNFKKRDYIYEHADELDDGLPLNLETTAQDHQDELAAGISGDTTTSSSTSSSPTSSTRVPRVYKTYSSHR
ncbi:protein wings apart-like [Drosophila madeirensis]|uniref:Protein wings apart-like n=1 Tax=Drosophila madeirensis TaxID=30013 RepID=A0AAU9G4V7_DROMD